MTTYNRDTSTNCLTTTPTGHLITTQPRAVDAGHNLVVELRFDDDCGNGHKDFGITGKITTNRGKLVACGCLHAEIEQVFPEFTSIIPFHLFNTKGPLHYIANTTYHAAERNCNAARRSANWPNATDEQLMLPRHELTALLEARLPDLMAEFYHQLKLVGFPV